MNEKIGLLMGGKSKEREISLRSGKNVLEALQKNGYEVVTLDTDDNLLLNIRKEKISRVYNALHGTYGEDGTIQGFLELYNIKYTGSKVLGSAICMNKAVTKQLLSEAGINNSPFQTVTYRDYIKGNLNFDKFDFPVVAKPNSEGSSIAVSIIETREELEKYFSDNLEEYKNVLVEKFIRGREITVGIIGCEELTVLPILELKPHNKFYDYEAKYTPGMTDFIIPADFPVQVENKIKTMAEKAHKICHCHGVSRVDMIVDENNIPYILEINTSPGMTDQSDLPAQAKAAGINFEQLVEIIMRSTD